MEPNNRYATSYSKRIGNFLSSMGGLLSNPKMVNASFILIILLLFPRYFICDLTKDGVTVDSSCNWAFKFFVANKQHYQWGKDVVFTSGPFSIFTVSRNFPPPYKWLQLSLDIYVIFTLTAIFQLLKRQKDYKILYLYILSLMVAMWDLNFLLATTNLLYLILLYKNPKWDRLAYAIAFNSAFLMYAKLNSLISTLFVVTTLLIMLLRSRRYASALWSLSLFVGINILIVRTMNISFSGYISTSYDTIAYYSYASYFYDPAYKAAFYGSVLISGLVLGIVAGQLISKNRLSWSLSSYMVLGNILILCFLLYKEGFTRMDRSHFTLYFCLMPLLLFCLHIWNREGQRLTIIPLVMSISMPILLGVMIFKKQYNNNIPLFSGPFPLVTYCTQLRDEVVRNEDISLRKTYNGKSYDYNINQCINASSNRNLNWHNRPAFQSMVTVSSRLDAMNADYYRGFNAPDTVFYDNTSIDDRNPLWDDPQCKWEILKKYKYLHFDTLNQLVLVKRENERLLTFSLILDTTLLLNQALDIPRQIAGIVVMNARVNYTLMGKIRALLYQPPQINVKANTFETCADTIHTFRYIPPLHNNQALLANYYVPPNHTNLSNGLFSDLCKVKPNVRSLTFSTDVAWGIEDKIQVKLYLVKDITAPNQREIGKLPDGGGKIQFGCSTVEWHIRSGIYFRTNEEVKSNRWGMNTRCKWRVFNRTWLFRANRSHRLPAKMA